MQKPAPALRPADFRPPPNGDRPAMTESGREWCAWVERGFIQLVTAINLQTAQIDQWGKVVTDLSNRLIAKPRLDSWNEITNVESLDAIKDTARDYRDRLAHAENEVRLAREANQFELGEVRKENRHLIRVIKGIVTTIIILALGGGGVAAVQALK